jgi:UDP:flavonoid glycosyltransferase YjiC (YdhE family)
VGTEPAWRRSAAGGWEPLERALQQHAHPLVVPVSTPVRHAELLPRCAALVHHGGAGTTAAALRCGTPQVVCAFQFDQHHWVSSAYAAT